MFMTLEECRSAWEKAGGHGTPAERIERNKRWLSYYSYLARRQEGAGAFSPQSEEIAAYLEQEGWLRPDGTVLDIGAGMGNYTLSFGKRCREVTALDMDQESLRVLRERAEKLSLPGIRTETAMWEQYVPAKKYSLVFSSMCPAICNYEELLKMESMAEDTCCLIAVTRGSYDLHRKNLMQLLDVRPKGGMTTEALWYYEMLYLMGRQPDVKNYTRHFAYDVSVEDTCAQGEVYYQIFGIPPARSRPVLERYYGERAENGMVHDESHLNLALISWHPAGATY